MYDATEGKTLVESHNRTHAQDRHVPSWGNNGPERNLLGIDGTPFRSGPSGGIDGVALRVVGRSEVSEGRGREPRDDLMRKFLHCWKISVAWVGICFALGIYFQFWGF